MSIRKLSGGWRCLAATLAIANTSPAVAKDLKLPDGRKPASVTATLVTPAPVTAVAATQMPAPAPVAAAPPTPSPPPPPPHNNCPAVVTVGMDSTSPPSKTALEVFASTQWQPVDGEIKFRLTGLAKPPRKVDVYFAWKHDPRLCQASAHVYQLDKQPGDTDDVFNYAARVPALDDPTERFFGVVGLYHRSWTSLVPIADMFVHATIADDPTAPPMQILMSVPVGITTPWIAIVLALLLLVIGGFVLGKWSTSRGVKGDPLLRIISTPNGVASLSQFQIILWTAVIGTGVTYVMLLTGNLIDVPTTTLELLGVTGLTLVGSKLVTNPDGSPKPADLPGIPTAVGIAGAPTPRAIALTWSAPAAAGEAISYVVEMRRAGAGNWEVKSADIGVPPTTIGGLDPNTDYEFRVRAATAAGIGPGSASAFGKTPADGGTGTAPPQIKELKARHVKDDANIHLSWAPPDPALEAYDSVFIQYRRVLSLTWATYDTRATSPMKTIGTSFDYDTDYEFQAFVVRDDAIGPASNIAHAKTIARHPYWSDLVMSSRANTEVDMARVQMLIFTTIAAAFTALTVVSYGAIPEIPSGELALIGLSNGVYLSSKAVGRRNWN